MLLCAAPVPLLAQTAVTPYPAGSLSSQPLVNLSSVDPSIVIELRYATSRNVTGAPIYPPHAPCLVRQGTAEKLKLAETFLRQHGYRLKIWDAYRPPFAQTILWQHIQNVEFIADPSHDGSLHSWGVAVDATLADSKGRELPMPTDFDAFSPDAAVHYHGSDPKIARDLSILQGAMGSYFFGTKSEWWHFIDKDWYRYRGPNRGNGIIPNAFAKSPPR